MEVLKISDCGLRWDFGNAPELHLTNPGCPALTLPASALSLGRSSAESVMPRRTRSSKPPLAIAAKRTARQQSFGKWLNLVGSAGDFRSKIAKTALRLHLFGSSDTVKK
jgi:hypothetical protein